MTKIEVYGRGVSFSLTEIAPELAKELTQTGTTEERFEELEENELEDTDAAECGITSQLEVHVDGQKIANPYEGVFWIEDAKDVPSKRRGEPGKYYYVNITEEKGLWLTRETGEAFDPDKLEIEIFDYVLPDKATLSLHMAERGTTSDTPRSMSPRISLSLLMAAGTTSGFSMMRIRACTAQPKC